MDQIVECVPNFSEGRSTEIIEKICEAIKTRDVLLISSEPGADTNRTVITFVGSPNEVLEAAFCAISMAAELIDMRKHKGSHSRMGATDVCPFIPVQNISIEECVKLAQKLGKRVAEELSIPVYLYEYAATCEERKNLATVRSGQYEGLEEKLKDEKWKPDFGDPIFNAKSGATVIGARDYLLAYNINLNSNKRKHAHDIALDIREAGRAKRDKEGVILRDKEGKALKVPGSLKCCKAVGWVAYNISQISMNLVNYHVTSLHQAFDECDEQARKRGLRVTGSELVGVVPLEAMVMAGKHYLKKMNLSTAVPEEDLVDVAIKSLGLDDIEKFDPQNKIIEYRIQKYIQEKKDQLLVNKTIIGFNNELSRDSVAPGGGSVASLCGTLSSALSAMVCNLTIGKKGYESVFEELETIGNRCQNLKDKLTILIDKDTEAFNDIISARRMPRRSEEDKLKRLEAIKQANRNATLIPLQVMEHSLEILELNKTVVQKGNENSLSDGGVANLLAMSSVEGAYYNVLINLQGITDDEEWKQEISKKAKKIFESANLIATKVKQNVMDRLLEEKK
eukprot:Anaeramoba_flamelloidesa1057518_359.p1 GENE.a1057518_359~~a1057518_359.p1  ORF type:complete len:565 (+),score=124.17 a1057518_359:115-1809(+)